MNTLWLYVVVALASAVGATVFERSVKDEPTKARIGAWISIVFGACFVLIYALKLEQDVFVLVMGVICITAGAHALESGRLQARIEELERKVTALGESEDNDDTAQR
jgi:hypothetical protein